MRVISSEELDLVSGGLTDETHHPVAKKTDTVSIWESIGNFFSGIFGGGSGSSGNSCVPTSNTSGGMMTTQTCGAGGVSTVTTSGPGYFSQTITTPNPGFTASGNYGPGGLHVGYNGGYTATTITCIGGRCTGPTSRRQ